MKHLSTVFIYSFFLLIVALFIPKALFAQDTTKVAKDTILVQKNVRTGKIFGSVKDKNTQEIIISATISVEGTQIVALSDEQGTFKLENIPVGSYNIKVSSLNFKEQVRYNIVVNAGNANTLNFELLEDIDNESETEAVEVSGKKSTVAVANIDTPLSIQSLSSEEIKSNPGGNFDISRVIQALPGVGGTTGGGGFRNDIIIRGGAPNENVYYLDGIEIPVINHFATQGSAGGPAGILNVNFIEDVTLSSSAFHSRYDNTLSSVLQFKQRDGNPERLQTNIRLSGTELAATLEGPINKKSKKTTFLASARRSYLQLLFTAIDLPIRPNYWDFQYKVTHKINTKTTLTAIGVGAIDEFKFGVPRKSNASKEYVLRATPFINQWNYTTGFILKRLITNGFVNVAVSRNMFDNKLDQFEDAQNADETKRTLGIKSQEIENKLRIDVNKSINGWKFSYGLVAQFVKYNNNAFIRIQNPLFDNSGVQTSPAINAKFNTAIEFGRYGLFGQISKVFGKLATSFGLRTDMNDYMTDAMNPLNTLSPRLSLSYPISDRITVNASVGQYYKLPTYTVLGFEDNAGNRVNKNTKYTASTHYVGGFEFLPTQSLRITAEGFYKKYSNYAVSVRNGISLANQGGDFGSIGNEAVTTNGEGRAFGLELFAQQKLAKGLFIVGSYTFFKSEFSGNDGKLVASAWDTRHLFSFILGKKFKKGWEMGLKYRFAGGTPYTPFTSDEALAKSQYVLTGRGTQDFTQLNTQRLNGFNQFDFRLDKKWNRKGFTFDLYLDVTNAFVFQNQAVPQYTFKRDEITKQVITTDGKPLASNGANAIAVILPNDNTSVVPTIGFIVEF